MKTRRKVDALIKHLGLRFRDDGKTWGYYAEVDCPDENGITNRVEALERRTSYVPIKESYVECKTCHCLLKKESAIKGEKRIEQVTKTTSNTGYVGSVWFAFALEDTIVQDYFCGRCAPKGGKK